MTEQANDPDLEGDRLKKESLVKDLVGPKENSSSIDKPQISAFTQFTTFISDEFHIFFFPGFPKHFPLRKKILLSRSSTNGGACWDLLQISLVILTCVMYVILTYTNNFELIKLFYTIDIFITVLFSLELLLIFYVTPSFEFWTDYVTYVDILSILPIYLSFYLGNTFSLLKFLQCLRATRLTRIFKSFKWMRRISGVTRQVIYLTFTLAALSFLAAGIVRLIENLVAQDNCLYISERTDYEPSCYDFRAFDHDSTDANSDMYTCSCVSSNCESFYQFNDSLDEPSGIRCIQLTFFDAFYYIIVTISTVGYGDIQPNSVYSRLFIILFVTVSLIMIPISVSRLQKLLSLKSPFRAPFALKENESHVIVCGYINSASKLAIFFNEFYHQDRISDEEYHSVILCPEEPNEEIRTLLNNQLLGSRVTYVIGSCTSTEDLKRVRADAARCMFFLANTETSGGKEQHEDAATVLRSLSVSNFNPSLECLVQVIRPEERTILQDSEVDCILCLDEFKTLLQARNAVCPGFSTFIENLFHSVEEVSDSLLTKMDPWYAEYLHGAGMEMYFVPLSASFLKNVLYDFSIIAEGLYMEFGVITLGMCNDARDSLVFTPDLEDLSAFENIREFYKVYNIALIMADDQYKAESIARACEDPNVTSKINIKVSKEEEVWPTRRFSKQFHEMRRSSREIQKNQKKIPEEDSDNSVKSDDEGDSEDEENEENYIGFTTYDKSKDKKYVPPNKENEIEMLGDRERHIRGPSFAALEESPSIKTGEKVILSPLKIQQKNILLDKKVLKGVHEEDSGDEIDTPFSHGRKSRVLLDATSLKDHVVIFGHDQYLKMFLSELRRPAVQGASYHSIVIIADEYPPGWTAICATYNDIFFIRAGLNRTSIALKANIDNAFSLIFLATRDMITIVDDQSVDAVTLFAFLKLEQIIPKHVFCSLELSHTTNMSVLNATIMKRERRNYVDNALEKLRTKKQQVENKYKKMQGIRKDSVLKSSRSFANEGAASLKKKKLRKEGMQEDVLIKKMEEVVRAEKELWETLDTFQIFPVFASARVFVPSSFESLLVQSFYVKMTPMICEKFVCGQLGQIVHQLSMPESMTGRKFLDLFRLFIANKVLCFGLYRSPSKVSGALLPYVYVSPPCDAILDRHDRIFCYGSHKNIDWCLQQFSTIKVKLNFYGRDKK